MSEPFESHEMEWLLTEADIHEDQGALVAARIARTIALKIADTLPAWRVEGYKPRLAWVREWLKS